MRTTKKTLLFLILFIGLSYAQYHGVYAPIRLYPITAANLAAKGFEDYERLIAMRDSFIIYSYLRVSGGLDIIVIDSVLSHRLAREKYRDTTFKKDTLFSLAGSGHKTLDTATYLSGVWSYKFHRLKAWTNITIKDTAGDLYFSSSGNSDSTIWATRYWTTTRYDTIGHLHSGVYEPVFSILPITKGGTNNTSFTNDYFLIKTGPPHQLVSSGYTASSFAAASHNQAWSTITSTPTTRAGYGITDAEAVLTFSAPLSRATNTISIPAATTSVSGHLTSTDWNTFNNKEPAISILPYTKGGLGTVTHTVNQFLTFTAAPDQIVSSGYTASSFAAASHNQAWSTITSTPTTRAGYGITDAEAILTFSTPLSRATNTISIPAATTAVSGHLTSTDWNTFNNKEPAISILPYTKGGLGTVTHTVSQFLTFTAAPDQIVSSGYTASSFATSGHTHSAITNTAAGTPATLSVTNGIVTAITKVTPVADGQYIFNTGGISGRVWKMTFASGHCTAIELEP